MTLKEIAERLGLALSDIAGNPDTEIRGVASLQTAKEGDLCYLSDKKLETHVEKSAASAFLVEGGIMTAKPHIRVPSTRLAFAKIIPLFVTPPLPSPGIHPSVVIEENVLIGKEARIGALTFIGRNSLIGDSATLHPQVHIGENVTLGSHTVIYPNVTILHNVKIGSHCVIHSGTVIGADGFGFVPEIKDGEFIRHYKIPQVGTVIIEDEVEIGANCCVDRGMLDATIIKKGTKLDNLVQIGHNVTVGEHTIIVSQAGIAGSATIGSHVILAGQAGVGDHVNIGDGAIVLGRGGVTKDVKDKAIVSGYPARDHNEQRKLNALLRQLPRIIARLKEKKIL